MLTTVVLPIAQILAAGATSVAAVAAWRSSSAAQRSADASERTAGRSDETARRAVEALGRATKPLLSIILNTHSSQFLSEAPASLKVEVVNNGSNRGVVLDVRVTHTGGFAAAPTVSMPQDIGSTAVSYTERYAITVPMGTMPRLLQPADVTDIADSAELITVEVTYADVGRVVTWRQRSRWRERGQKAPDGRLNYTYVVESETEPEIVSEASAPNQAVMTRSREWYRLRRRTGERRS